MKTLQERFEVKYMPEPNSGCWLWDGKVTKYGYGRIKNNGKEVYSHRVSYELYNGEIPDGIHVLHKCDVRCCVNPDHLFLGTDADNVADKCAKGRQCRGETHGMVKLTERQVLSIRNDDRFHEDIALEYGVSRSLVTMIKNKRVWSYLT